MKLFLGGFATAAVIAVSPVPAGAEVVHPDKILCKRNPDVETGSNLRKQKKTCMKASEWKYLEQINEQARLRLQDQIRGPRAPDVGGLGGQ